VGKTTLVERALEQLRGPLRIAGFTTTEMRGAAGERLGFRILTVEGKQAELAHVGLRSRAHVGRYGIDVEAFEGLALPEIARRDVDLIVIDEIGKMECASPRFCRAVEDALDAPVNVLATLGMGHLPFLQAVRLRRDVEVLALTDRNRGTLAVELCARLLPETK
jgi:nucleoside-triphosphatase